MDSLLLLSKNDIPFTQAALTIHQPTIKQIGYIGEQAFFVGCQLLMINRNDLNEQDKNHLGNQTNFDILMSIVNQKNDFIQKNVTYMKLVLILLFPDCTISFIPRAIVLIKDKKIVGQISKENFTQFQEIIDKIFCWSEFKGNSQSYNPGSQRAEQLAEKFKKYHQKLAKMKNQGDDGQDISILSRYISILAVGQHKDINSLLQYTVYQLCDEFNRFMLHEDYLLFVQEKLSFASPKDLKGPENWIKDIHSNYLNN